MLGNMRILTEGVLAVAAVVSCGFAVEAAAAATGSSGLPFGATGVPLSTRSTSQAKDTAASSCRSEEAVAAAATLQETGPAAGSAAAPPASSDASTISPSDESILAQGCTFFLVRHGQSHANVAGKIVSGMEGGVDPANGLTEEGLEQARTAGQELKEVLLKAGCSPANTIVLTSPFSRSKETAEAIREILDCELREERDLRERFFGDLDGGKDTNYEKVWALDAISSRHGELGVESAAEVAARAAAVVSRARKEVSIRQRYYSGEEGQPFPPGPSAVILVSHGDTLAMLQCILAGRPVEGHRSLMPHLENCGIRVLRPPPNEATATATAAVEEAADLEASASSSSECATAEGQGFEEGCKMQGCGSGDSGGGGRDGARAGGAGVQVGRKEPGAGAEAEARAGGGAGAFRMTGARVFRRPEKEADGRGKQDMGGDAQEEQKNRQT